MPLDSKLQRNLASELFNHVWTLLDKPQRTPEEEQRMVHAAHASRFLWEDIGDAQNRSIGEWQISRVYAVLKRAEPALYHARLALHWAEVGKVPSFYRAYGHEAIARSLAVAGDRVGMETALRAARALAAEVTEADERKMVEEDLKTIQLSAGGLV